MSVCMTVVAAWLTRLRVAAVTDMLANIASKPL